MTYQVVRFTHGTGSLRMLAGIVKIGIWLTVVTAAGFLIAWLAYRALASGSDKADPQPRFHLGCIAREQGRFADALQHLNATAQMDAKHNSYEVWRELGATNLALGHADPPLADRRPHRPRRRR